MGKRRLWKARTLLQAEVGDNTNQNVEDNAQNLEGAGDNENLGMVHL